MTTATFTVERSLDHAYAVADGRALHVDLYLPRDPTHPPPLVVWLHGGGWRAGDRRSAPDLSAHFASSGIAMASIDYRLSRDAVFPAQLHDVKVALRWLRDHAAEHGFDARRIGVWGASAGGHLAALAALTADPSLDPAVRAVVVAYAPIDFLAMDAQRDAQRIAADDPSAFALPQGARTGDADSYESRLIGAPIGERPDLARAASPLTYVRRVASRFMIVHGVSDRAVPMKQSVELYQALEQCGNHVQLRLLDGLGHGFLERDDPRAAPVFDDIEAFFRQHLVMRDPMSHPPRTVKASDA
jgi:acetyl esterase/lipase